MRLETQAVHAGFDHDPATHAVAVPVYQTAAYAFDSADHGAALFDLEEEGYRYSRIANPTVAVLEERVAAMEGGAGALCVASGQAALHHAFANVAAGGGEIVCAPQLYGATHTLLTHVLPGEGISGRFAESDDPDALAALVGPRTRALFCESIANPAGAIADLERLAAVAHAAGVPLIVDNTVATPCLIRPIEWGADVVVHSLTKFMGGHGTTLGGAIVDGGRFPWMRHAERFPQFTRPDASYHGLVYAERFGPKVFAARARAVYARNVGATLSPLSAFLLLQGIETVALRMERHVANARRVAEHLRAHPAVQWVSWAGFEDSPYHPLACKHLGGEGPSLLTFGVAGGLDGGKAAYDALQLVKRLVNIGDAKSLCCHPASTTHRQMPPDAQIKAGVRPEALRLSVGIEHVDDILADLDRALAAAQACASHRRAA